MQENPFRPGFGAWPPAFVGREQDELLFREGLANGPGSRYHNSMAIGPRGVGKTVLLAAFRDIAESEGYVAVAVDANDGMIRRICRDLRLLETSMLDNPKWRIGEVRAEASLGLVGGSVQLKPDVAQPESDPMLDLKPLLERVDAVVRERGGAGVVLTVDELHAAKTDELERLGNDLQHLQSIVFAGAALPTIDDQVFSASGATFFTRVARFLLDPLSLSEAVSAIRPPLEDAGINFDVAELTATVAKTNGYPYLVQLLGYELWRSLDEGSAVTADALEAAFVLAHEQSVFDVLQPTWRQLSPSSKRVLGVIAEAQGEPVPVAEIREVLGKSSSWFSVYRSRLIKTGIIQSPARGLVELTGGERAAQWISEQLIDDE